MANGEGKNPRYVTIAQCAKQVQEFQVELFTVKKALVGEDMRGGLVKDVQEIKTATSAVKTIVVPIIISVSATLITYLLVSAT